MRLRGEPKPMITLKDFGFIGVVTLKLELKPRELQAAQADGSFWSTLCTIDLRDAPVEITLRALLRRRGVTLWAWTVLPLREAKLSIWASLEALHKGWEASMRSVGQDT